MSCVDNSSVVWDIPGPRSLHMQTLGQLQKLTAMAFKVLLGKTNEGYKEINITAPVTVEFDLSKSVYSYLYCCKHVKRKGCISVSTNIY